MRKLRRSSSSDVAGSKPELRPPDSSKLRFVATRIWGGMGLCYGLWQHQELGQPGSQVLALSRAQLGRPDPPSERSV